MTAIYSDRTIKRNLFYSPEKLERHLRNLHTTQHHKVANNYRTENMNPKLVQRVRSWFTINQNSVSIILILVSSALPLFMTHSWWYTKNPPAQTPLKSLRNPKCMQPYPYRKKNSSQENHANMPFKTNIWYYFFCKLCAFSWGVFLLVSSDGVLIHSRKISVKWKTLSGCTYQYST